MLPSQQELKELFDYDSSTGLLTWRQRPNQNAWNTRYAGKPALNSKNRKGYLYGSLGESTVRAHRVIWKWLYGTEPNKIDHENGIRSDNRKDNLRDTTPEGNQKNTKKRVDNTSGHVGVRQRGQTFHAYINHKRKQISLGSFNTFAEAVAARKQGEVTYDYHQNHGR